MRIAIMGSGGIGGMCGSQSLGAPFSIQVAVQHNSAFPAHYESAGKVLMGLKPSDPGW